MIRKWLMTFVFAAAMPIGALSAPADSGVRVVVPAHDIPRGQTISEDDLTYGMLPGNALIAGVVTNFSAVKDMEARRLLHAGEAFRTDDLRRPIVVTKGQTITMHFDAPGVELTAMGRAMSEGGIGDTVIVQNPASFRMVNGVVSAPGAVTATGPASPNQRTARN